MDMEEMIENTANDIPAASWIDTMAPTGLRPFLRLARLDRPIGTWLLLFPCWWSITLASPGRPDFWLLGLFALGAVVMRGAGCTVNDMADRNFDARVARTAIRPLPSGEVTLFRAGLFLALQLLIGLTVLIQLNSFTIAMGIASLGLVAIYPFAKRVTYWPQAVLGLTFNWGALLGWAAVRGQLDPPAVLLYAAGFFWTLGYDTIYAHQDKDDDMVIGVKSLALHLGDATRPWLFAFYSLTVALMAAAGWLAELSWPFYVLLIGAAGHLFWQAVSVDIDDMKDCLNKFRSNRHLGWVVLVAILAGRLVGE